MERRCFSILPLMTVTLVFMSACGARPEGDDTDLGTARSAALNGNSLNGSGLQGNSLTGYMLASNPLTPSTISADAMAAIQDPSANGELSRQLLSYTVSCALDGTQSFDFSWTDSSGATYDETYVGLLGLAPDWSSQALGATEQLWVSACLVSRVNYFGIRVELSSRGPNDALAATDPDELDTYTMQEGAFWGNVFTETPYGAACDYPADDDHSRSLLRECAAGYVDSQGNVRSCPNVLRVGSCVDLCAYDESSTYYDSCNDPNQGTATQVVTVYLHG
jgi:hypothetical protein